MTATSDSVGLRSRIMRGFLAAVGTTGGAAAGLDAAGGAATIGAGAGVIVGNRAGAGGGGADSGAGGVIVGNTAGATDGSVNGRMSAAAAASREPGSGIDETEIGGSDEPDGASTGAVSIASRQNRDWHR